ncbi:MAG: hypothetical protein RIF36_07790 [Imperialibacter sp.]|uniref:hypothetical protein n=1 Tax=Imperialibacter sp. TaxID=2038411 RepID=UPI0032ECEC0F
MKKLQLFLILLILSFPLFSQKSFTEGFIVTLAGDTIKGKINEKDFYLNFSQCQFKADQGDQVIKYAPGEIAGFSIEGLNYFISESITEVDPDRPMKFIEVLVTGRTSLYKYKEHFIFKKDTLQYMVIESAPMIREQNGVYTNAKANLVHFGILTYLFQDCPEIELSPSKTNINRDKLISLTKQYNTCRGSDYEVVFKKKPIARLAPSVYTDFGQMKLAFDYSGNTTGDETLLGSGPIESSIRQTGFAIGILLPRISDRLMVEVGMNFSQFDYSFLHNVPYVFPNGNIAEAVNDVIIDGKMTKIPLVIHYELFSKSKITPYIRAGMILRSMKYGGDVGRKRYVQYEGYYDEDYYEFESANPQPGFLAAAGLEGKLGRHIGIFGQLQFNTFGDATQYDNNEEGRSRQVLNFKMKRNDYLVGFGIRVR